MFAKINVNGPKASPIFAHLKSETNGADVQWNFEKFLVVDGKVTKRYPDSMSPADIIDDIEAGLGLTEEEEEEGPGLIPDHDEA